MRRILVLDSSNDLQQLLAGCLEQGEYQLEIAASGRAAVEEFIAGDFELVLMDARASTADAGTAVRKIRDWEAQRGRWPATILACTGPALHEESAGGWDAGLGQLVSQDALPRAIEEHLKVCAAPRVRAPRGIEDLIPRYLDHRKDDLQALATALEQNDYPAIRTLGHNMRGTGKSFGFDAIGAIGASLEEAAKTRSGEQIRADISALADYLNHLGLVR